MRVRTWDKAAGLPVFPRRPGEPGDCVLERLLQAEPWRLGIAWPDGFAGGIAHRLDNATSGALLVADDLDALSQLRARFDAGTLRKVYWFEARHEVDWDAHRVALAIAHHPRRADRMVVRRSSGTPHRGHWQPAATDLRRLGPGLWEASMRTGVRHQIRVHAATAGLALRGDALYGGGPALHPDRPFHLHHVGVEDDEGWRSDAVPEPIWGNSLTSG
jgi:23S rRNA-/tRNA-specific pseudouridylate synthase